jgi:hypothetical protein
VTVDEFVETSVLPEFRPVVATIRSLMKEHAPGAQEVISYGMPVYKGKKIFAWITSTGRDVSVGFSRGVQMEDRYGLLRGAAKGGSRRVKMKDLDEVDKAALGYYIKQAVKLDKG